MSTAHTGVEVMGKNLHRYEFSVNYDYGSGCSCDAGMYPDEHGEYVSWSDYEKISTRVEELETEAARMDVEMQLILDSRAELARSFAVLLTAAKDYIDYEWSGDPWEEDSRAMGEMALNDLARQGKLEEFRKMIDKALADTK